MDPERPVSNTTTVTKMSRCPVCGHVVQPGGRFCEACGHDVTAWPVPGRWLATIAADREFHAFLAPDGIDYPRDPTPPWTLELDADEVTIGRSADASIALNAEPIDPSVSRAHACLRRQADGSYVVVDLASSNGTWVNDDPNPIAPRTPVPLGPDDRIHLGAWTTITVQRHAD
jgi:hypothetical protein